MIERQPQTPPKDVIKKASELSEALAQASLRPLTPEIFDPETVMLALDLVEIDNPDRLAQTKMRPNSPKYEAVREALGQNRFDSYVAWSKQASQDQPRLVNKKTGKVRDTRNRGLMQVCAGFVSVALGVTTPEAFCQATNARLAKSLSRRQTPPDNLDAYGKFKKTTASVPEDSLVGAWQQLTSDE